MGKKYWVEGWWTNCKHEAHAIAKRLGGKAVHLTDGLRPVAVVTHATA